MQHKLLRNHKLGENIVPKRGKDTATVSMLLPTIYLWSVQAAHNCWHWKMSRGYSVDIGNIGTLSSIPAVVTALLVDPLHC